MYVEEDGEVDDFCQIPSLLFDLLGLGKGFLFFNMEQVDNFLVVILLCLGQGFLSSLGQFHHFFSVGCLPPPPFFGLFISGRILAGIFFGFNFLVDHPVPGDLAEMDIHATVGTQFDFEFEAVEAGFADVVLVHAEHHGDAVGGVEGQVADLAGHLLLHSG